MSDADRWTAEYIAERWNATTDGEREAWMRYGKRKAPWESTPDAALRLLKWDHRIPLSGAHVIDAIFRAAYNELVAA